jgi:hypothetical protein
MLNARQRLWRGPRHFFVDDYFYGMTGAVKE